MALFKQWEILNKCVAESDNQNSPLIPVPYSKSSSNLQKSSNKDSATKEKRFGSANQEKSSAASKFLGDLSNTTKKENILIGPIYPKMPAAQPQTEVPAVDDGDIITLSGAQLKCLIKSFAKEAIRSELTKVLQNLTGP